jgi:uncharacterized protein YlxW (UPF0749 family)
METKHKISLFLVSVVLGGMLTVQFSTVHRPKVETANVGDNLQLTAELTQERDRQRFFYSEIDDIEQQIRSYQSKSGDRDELVKAMKEELSKVKMLAGMTEIQGNGVTVTIEDSVDAIAIGVQPNNLMLGEYLYQLVNALNSNGAQAISIDNHRLVSTSSIRRISDTNLQVNTVMIDPQKIVLKAVGNIDQMKIGMNLYKQLFHEMGKDFVVSEVTNNNLRIPAYDRPVEFKYAKPEGDKAL